MLKLSSFNFQLPEELIAQHPSPRRDESRLMVIDRSTRKIEHRIFKEIVEFLHPGDVLVVNNTRVIPARLWGRKIPTMGRVEVLLLQEREGKKVWEVLVRPSRRVRRGGRLEFGEGKMVGEVLEEKEGGKRVMEFSFTGDFRKILEEIGEVPLPPYIKRDHTSNQDRERYQTVYAEREGAIAAPTAGFHFTRSLLKEIKKMGVEIASITLHTGGGTFKPIKVEDVRRHKMEKEYYEIDEEEAEKIKRGKEEGRRIVVVGTTTVRALEGASDERGNLKSGKGWTNLFIYPGYRFKVVDALITNFHLPKSTLILLVSAFAGRELILTAYKEAIREKYRFYSFGDAMLIL